MTKKRTLWRQYLTLHCIPNTDSMKFCADKLYTTMRIEDSVEKSRFVESNNLRTFYRYTKTYIASL